MPYVVNHPLTPHDVNIDYKNRRIALVNNHHYEYSCNNPSKFAYIILDGVFKTDRWRVFFKFLINFIYNLEIVSV
jgi:hypothetical protein